MLQMLAMVSSKRTAATAFRLFCTPFNRSTSPISSLFQKGQRLELFVDNVKIVGYRWNFPQEKKALIAHGFESSARNFDKYVPMLISKGYEVMAFDAPAHGESGGREINALKYKNMIEVIHDNYGPMDFYLAHSFGGLAIALALENIVHTEQTKIVLIAPATETSTSISLMYDFLKLNKETRAEVENLVIRIAGKPVSWYSISRALQNIKAQILWIHDSGDDITPLRDVDPIIKHRYANIQFMITSGLGHHRIYRDPGVMQAVDNFS